MFAHYLEHRQERSDLSFSDFVVMHYGTHSDRDSDSDDAADSRLPFKSAECGALNVQATHPEAPFILTASIAHEQELCSLAPCDVVPTLRPNDIWQPPRA